MSRLPDFSEALKAQPPKGKAETDKVLYRWADPADADADLVREARQCKDFVLPFHAHDLTWRVTWCAKDETGCYAIEGVEWT